MDSDRCDIAVVGGGIAGMITAVRAAQAGRQVLVLERLADDRYLCNTRLTGGVFHCALRDIRTPAAALPIRHWRNWSASMPNAPSNGCKRWASASCAAALIPGMPS